MHKDHKEIAKSVAIGIAAILVTLLAIEALSVLAPNIYGDVKTTVAQWGVIGVFVGVFLGSTALPFPTDLLFVTAINLAPDLSTKLLFTIVAIIAGFLGAILNYWLARAFREKLVYHFINPKQLEGAKKWFDKYGPLPILIFGIIPASPIFDPITFVAGLTGMNFKEFTIYSFASRVLHFAVLALIAVKVIV